MALAVSISMVMQVVSGISIFLCATSVGIGVDIQPVILSSSLSSVANAIPFSLFGAGPSEAAGAAAFLWYGLDYGDAAIIVAMMYSLKLLAALEGAAIEFYQGGVDALRLNKAERQ